MVSQRHSRWEASRSSHVWPLQLSTEESNSALTVEVNTILDLAVHNGHFTIYYVLHAEVTYISSQQDYVHASLSDEVRMTNLTYLRICFVFECFRWFDVFLWPLAPCSDKDKRKHQIQLLSFEFYRQEMKWQSKRNVTGKVQKKYHSELFTTNNLKVQLIPKTKALSWLNHKQGNCYQHFTWILLFFIFFMKEIVLEKYLSCSFF